jgi:hypothetical protein
VPQRRHVVVRGDAERREGELQLRRVGATFFLRVLFPGGGRE